MINLLIVDDQELFAEGLTLILTGNYGDEIKVIGKVTDGEQAVSFVNEQKIMPDLILMDIRMPNMDGLEATRIIHANHPEIKILTLTTFDDEELVYKAMLLGCVGFVLKNTPEEELVRIIRLAVSGFYCFSPIAAEQLVKSMKNDSSGLLRHEEILILTEQHKELSRREIDVLHLLSLAYDNSAIADNLFLSKSTVKNHVSIIYDKLGIHNRLELIQKVRTEVLDAIGANDDKRVYLQSPEKST